MKKWEFRVEDAFVTWTEPCSAEDGVPYRAVSLSPSQTVIETADARRVGLLDVPLNPYRRGLLTVTGTPVRNIAELRYRGPADLRIPAV
jgi:hypothetical protein